jgi:hypothetical protein
MENDGLAGPESPAVSQGWGGMQMNTMGERIFVYSALLAVCVLLSALLGLPAGIWSLLQIVAVVEFIYWLGAIGQGNANPG